LLTFWYINHKKIKGKECIHVTIFIILQERELGLRLNIIIIAEGAIDIDGNAITATMIKDVGSFIMFD